MPSKVLDTVAVDDAKVRHVTVRLIVVHVVTDDERVGDRESDVVRLEAARLDRALLQQRRNAHRLWRVLVQQRYKL